MPNLDELRQAHEQADSELIGLSNAYDEAFAKLQDDYRGRVQKAREQAARAQKAWLDGQVIAELQDRPDGEQLAASLGLELPGAGDE